MNECPSEGAGPRGHGADSMLPLVYKELRAAAGRMLGKERSGHTLQPTALVHEAWAKLAKGGVRFQDDLHFFNTAAQAMRQVLIDHSLARGRQKRGGGRARVAMDDLDLAQADVQTTDWLGLDEAMSKLTSASPRRAQVVMLRFYAGLSDAEISRLLGVSEPTVRRDWLAARAWLFRELQP